MGCMSLLLELNAAEGIIAPAGIFALTIFLGKRKKQGGNFVGQLARKNCTVEKWILCYGLKNKTEI